MSMTEAIVEVAGGNPGALRVCSELSEALGSLATFDFELMKQEGILKEEVWYLYSRGCGSDIDALHAAIMQRTAIQKLETVPQSKFYKPE